jgi:hypothetical protein
MGRAAFVLIMLLGLVKSAVAGDPAKANAAAKAEAVSEAKSVTEAPREATAPSLQPGHVAMLSNAFAAKRIGAFHYQVTRIAYEDEPGSRLWTIHYVLGPAPDGRKPDPDAFEVQVDDRTGAVRFRDQ